MIIISEIKSKFMGCSSSNTGGETKKKKSKKPPKDYASDPNFQLFVSLNASGDRNKPKDMAITRETVKPALEGAGITCRGDGSGYEEFCIMDKDFRNCVRFKDFCKFVKAYRRGKAYDGTDSSLSSSDIFDDVVRNMWKKMDPERTCKVSIDHCCEFVYKELNIADDGTFRKIIAEEMDENQDKEITFKEFDKFFGKLK